MTSLNVVPIKDMRPQMRGFNCEFIVLHKGEYKVRNAVGRRSLKHIALEIQENAEEYLAGKHPPNHLRNGDTIWMFTIADITGSVRMLLWNNDGVLLRPGDICRIYNA
ncbi:hypothetical protein BC937DRAFT_89095 [Endogone sp. FLAS-F59071]|nr:hypothetical protein BC937DRAFT_89095 [Endogone sp. FLAS-F59071]|eukprot:RUS18156.1 hypothetical protein BC937DRAFT_89095 [Endogone sp. FLAS-F59071]